MTSPKSNSFTELFAISAIEKILVGYKTIIEKGSESRHEIIEEFLVASTYAGIAFGNLESILNKLSPKKKLSEYGMRREDIEIFTDSVIEKQQRLLVNNYEPFSREDILEIYQSLY